MNIARIPGQGNAAPVVLLRESYQVGGKRKQRTISNLSKVPEHITDQLRILLKGGVALPSLGHAISVLRTWSHGHVAAVLGCAHNLSLVELLHRRPSRQRALAFAMILARIIDPRSMLATARALHRETLEHTLGEELRIHDADEKELHSAMGWLIRRQSRIEGELAIKHLSGGAIVLCNLTSLSPEGTFGPRAEQDYCSKGKQTAFALFTNREGCPVATEVLKGVTAEADSLGAQLRTVRKRFATSRNVIVGDSELLTEARIRNELRPEGLEWISSVRAPEILKLVESGHLNPALLSESDMAEITEPDLYPEERLIVCRNPRLASERRSRRQSGLLVTEGELKKIDVAVRRNRQPLRGKELIAAHADQALRRNMVGHLFDTFITDDGFLFARSKTRITLDAALDGVYVIRTNVPADELGAADVVRSYRSLRRIEQISGGNAEIDYGVSPAHRIPDGRSRAHQFLGMLAYHVEWRMRQALAPLLYDYDDPAETPSPAARAESGTESDPEDLPMHSFQTLLSELATLTRNRVKHVKAPHATTDILTNITPMQARIFDLLGVSP